MANEINKQTEWSCCSLGQVLRFEMYIFQMAKNDLITFKFFNECDIIITCYMLQHGLLNSKLFYSVCHVPWNTQTDIFPPSCHGKMQSRSVCGVAYVPNPTIQCPFCVILETMENMPPYPYQGCVYQRANNSST